MIREHSLYDFNSFKFVKVCFMAQDLSTVVNVQWKKKKMCILLLSCGLFRVCQLKSSG